VIAFEFPDPVAAHPVNSSGVFDDAAANNDSSCSSSSVLIVSSRPVVAFANASTCSAPIFPLSNASANDGASSSVLERRSRRRPSAAETPPTANRGDR
jgi:hypothetical protein